MSQRHFLHIFNPFFVSYVVNLDMMSVCAGSNKINSG